MAEKRNGLPMQLLTLLIAVAGVAIGLWQYRDTNSQGYRKEIWTAQKALYEQAIAAASTIANGESLESVAVARKGFWELYWGKLAMLEARSVERAMIAFGEILAVCEDPTKNNTVECFKPVPGNNRTPLQKAALDLAHCARDSLRTTWEPVDIGKLTTQCPKAYFE